MQDVTPTCPLLFSKKQEPLLCGSAAKSQHQCVYVGDCATFSCCRWFYSVQQQEQDTLFSHPSMSALLIVWGTNHSYLDAAGTQYLKLKAAIAFHLKHIITLFKVTFCSHKRLCRLNLTARETKHIWHKETKKNRKSLYFFISCILYVVVCEYFFKWLQPRFMCPTVAGIVEGDWSMQHKWRRNTFIKVAEIWD